MRAFYRSATVAALSVLGGTGGASAADLPVLAAPLPIFTWTGFYAGVNAGVGWGRSSASNTGQALVDNQAPFMALGALNPSSQLIPGNTANASTGDSKVNPFGFLAGGQIGFNYQVGGSRIVLGLEADLDAAGISGSGTFVGHANDAFTAQQLTYSKTASSTNYAEALSAAWSNPVFTRSATGTDRISGRVDWLGTVRGRVGFLVTPDLLLYVTGGLAYGGVKASGDYALDIDYGLSANSFALGYVQALGSNAAAQATTTAGTGAASVITSGSTWDSTGQTSIAVTAGATGAPPAQGSTNLNVQQTALPTGANFANSVENNTSGATVTGVYTSAVPNQTTTTFIHATTNPQRVASTTHAQGSSGSASSQTNMGVTIGGGMEWRFLPNWSLKGEALYYDLGTQTIVGPALTSSANIVTAMAPSSGVPAIDAKIANFAGTQNATNRTVTKVRFDGVVLRTGINYHF